MADYHVHTMRQCGAQCDRPEVYPPAPRARRYYIVLVWCAEATRFRTCRRNHRWTDDGNAYHIEHRYDNVIANPFVRRALEHSLPAKEVTVR